MYKHVFDLTDEDIADANYICAVCTPEIPVSEPIDVYRSLRIYETERPIGQRYGRAPSFTVELPSREYLPKLQSMISAVIGADITAFEDEDY